MTLWTVLPLLGIGFSLWWYRRVCVRRAMRTWLYRWVMRTIIPHARISVCHADMTAEKYILGRKKLRAGDIVLATDKRALSTLCVPGVHTHALLCIGELDGIMTCAEMTHEGYGEVPFAQACYHASRVVSLRCPDMPQRYIDDMVSRCRAFAGTKYDTRFELGPDEIYCSELPYLCDWEYRLGVVPSRERFTGQLVVTPDDLLASNVVVIYDSDRETA